ncbi:hypothetical protein CHS0354_026977 [Potamilus streckersoni]|uniref:CUB domain-containing protein n=1 Tax=Potamilus streckersoni TaxID=2493646 RepID=A0AAE0VUD2_9BIVA|nr:hypothetical protein CHS0354_026977 [Potamilus streckersoni]
MDDIGIEFMELIKKAFILAFVGLHHLCAGIPDVRSIQLCTSRHTFVQEIGDSGIIWFDEIKMGNGYPSPCILQIESCSSCRLTVSLIDFDYFTCSSQDFRDDSCSYQCNYLYIFDAHYKNQTIHYYRSKSQFTSPFISESSSIFIGLCHRSATVNVTLRYVATKKKITIQSSSLGENSTGYITSPFFPTGYVQNFEEYEFEFISENQNDYIQVIFDDWDLSPKTELAFNNSNIVGPVYGAKDRPVVVSNSYHLTMSFNTGSPTGNESETNFMGFKATYRFVSNSSLISNPDTACDCHYPFNPQEAVLNFKPVGLYNKYFDCVWVVKKEPGYDAVHIKLIEFSSRQVNVSGNKVEIYRGLTSMGEKLVEIMSSSTPFFESDDMGFYVRLTGRYQAQDRLVFTYASYSNTSLALRCRLMTGRCCNYMCIKAYFHCRENFCAGLPDEMKYCNSTYDVTDENLHIYDMIVMLSSVVPSVFIVIICLLIIIICKCCNSARRNQNTIPSVDGNVSRRRRDFVGQRQRARERDSLPTYDEAIQSPPSWYCKLTFNISASDAALPSPPSYSEAIHEDVLLVNTSVTPGSPNSTDSSQSECCHCPAYDTSYSSNSRFLDLVSTPRYAGQRSESQQKNRADDLKGVEAIDANQKKEEKTSKLESEGWINLNESTTPEQIDSGLLTQQGNVNTQHASRPQSSSRIKNKIISSVMPDQSNTSVQRQMFDVTRPVESSSHSRSRSHFRRNPVTMPSPSHKRSRNNSKPCNQRK